MAGRLPQSRRDCISLKGCTIVAEGNALGDRISKLFALKGRARETHHSSGWPLQGKTPWMIRPRALPSAYYGYSLSGWRYLAASQNVQNIENPNGISSQSPARVAYRPSGGALPWERIRRNFNPKRGCGNVCIAGRNPFGVVTFGVCIPRVASRLRTGRNPGL